MMKQIEVDLEINNQYWHSQQIYAGFTVLAQNKYIKLNVKRSKDFKYDNPLPYISATINGKKVIYEMHDSWEIPAGIDLKGIDIYFKRSYHAQNLKNHPLYPKIFKLGLNYYVTARGSFGISNPLIDYYTMSRDYKGLFKRILNIDQCHIEDIEQYPNPNPKPFVLFMTRAWDPKDSNDEKKKAQRHEINEMRALCIRILRQNFGPNFLGGFIEDSFSRTNYRDCITDNKLLTEKPNYLRLMKKSDICIATTGLHGSIGWKFGEYLAASKAIVSEKLNYEVPGGLSEGIHYLGFNSSEELIEKVNYLANNREALITMMHDNMHYYRNFVYPPSLVLNSLIIVLKNQ